jgi:small conductance mechanosensitive channel
MQFPQLDLSSLNFLQAPLLKLLRICVIVVVAMVTTRFIHRFVHALRLRIFHLMQKRAGGPDVELEKRSATLGGIIRKTAAVVVWSVAIVMSMREAGFDIAPILAGAGVVGLAVGFGAQNLVRDVISGLFILVENQIRVNDVAIINGTGGLVEEINLRTTVLRGLDGTVHIFPNGVIDRLSNMTREYSYYVFDIRVAYKEDTDRVVAAVKEVGAQIMTEDPYKDAIISPIEILGVDALTESAVIVKARFKTRPIQQWTVGREMNRRLKKKFDELGIEIPFPHQRLYFGEPNKPFRIETDGLAREEVAEVVREVLRELDQAGQSRPETARQDATAPGA